MTLYDEQTLLYVYLCAIMTFSLIEMNTGNMENRCLFGIAFDDV